MNNMNNVYLLLKLPGIQNDFNNKVFVPLIPGYRVYTKLGETYFRLDLEWCNKENIILYKWYDFATIILLQMFNNGMRRLIIYLVCDCTLKILHVSNTPEQYQ